MGLAVKRATFMRTTRLSLIQILSLGLIVSTLSLGSVTPASALDLSAADCPTIQVTTTSTVSYARSADFCVLEFKSGTNNFTVPAGVQSATIIVVGGGGGGGARSWSGGGGAGGVLYGTSYPLTANTTIALSVGTGGTGATSGSTSGANGGDTTFGALTAKGGGGGAGYGWRIGYTANGSAGGSGGGSGEEDAVNAQGGATNQGSFSNVGAYGNRGGHQLNSSGSQAGAGGGGAGAAGGDVSASSGSTNRLPGAGGTGVQLVAGKTFNLAAGGGGGSEGTAGAGGSIGGGGAGGNATTNGGSPEANTGSGGGGAGSASNGGSGGSGLVVIAFAYDITYNANSATGGTAPASQTKGHGTSLVLRTNTGTLARTGYTFAGWNTQADGLGTSYAAGATYATNASLNLFAQWTLNACTSSTTSSGGYTYVAFKTAGICGYTAPANVTAIDLLVVAGGGGGASRHAGGGGAGGLINATSVTTNGSAFSITVGAGGAGGAAQSSGGTNASNGESSVVSGGGITTRTAVGGGGGGYGNSAGASGGSGGGGGSSGAGGSGSQGNSGSAGLSDNSNYWVGGGGGGAGGPGTTSSSTKAGSGGAGLEISWIPTAVGATLGVGTTGTTGRTFAGGGGGGSDRSPIVGGDAGTGGGGAGSTVTATPSAGTANTGGGGGGSGISGVGSGSLKGGDGGSGLIVIRYAMPAVAITTPTSGLTGTVGAAYSITLAKSGGSGSGTFSIASGSLPAGLTLDGATGVISGTPTAGGTFAITARITDTNTTVATTSSFSFVIGKANQAAISAPVLSATSKAFPYSQTPLTVTSVTGGSSTGGLSITSVANGSATGCAWDGTTLTASTSGTCTLTVTKAADSNYEATTTTATFTFNKATTTTVITCSNQTFTGSALTPCTAAVTGAGGLSTTTTVTYANNTNAGTATANATYAESTNHLSSTATQVSFTIAKASQTITFGALSNKTLGSGTYSVSATSSSALTVAFTSATTGVCTISSTTITLVTAGTCTINANQIGDTNYLAATQVPQSFTVATTLSITTPSGTSLQGTFNTAFTSLTISASGGAGTKTFTATGSLPAGVILSTAGVISGTPSTAGDFDLTVTVTDANSATATTSSFRISIAKGVSGISLSVGSYTYTGSGLGPDSATISGSTGAVTYAYAGRGSTSYTSSPTKPTAVGTYTVTATLAADANYASVSTTTQNFEIASAGLVVTPTISASSMVFGTSGGSLPTISHTKNPNIGLTTNPTCALYLASDTGFVTTQTLSETLAVGSYVVRCTGAALTNYTITYGTNPTFSVTKANQGAISLPVLSATSKTFPYSQTSLTVNSVTGGSGTGALSISSVADGTATGCSLSGSTLTATASGTCTLTVTKAADSNFNAATTTVAFTFNKATQSLSITSTAPAAAKVAGTTYTVTATGGASGNAVTFTSTTVSVCTVSTATVTFLTVGTCTIAANQASTSDYDAATQATQSFTVAKGDPSLSSFTNVTKTFGDSAFTLTAPTVANSLGGAFTYASGTVGTSTVSTATATIVAAGTSVITATFTPTDTTNYNTATITMTLTVNEASSLTPTFGTPTRTNDGYTVQISNHAAGYVWAGTATASGLVSISGTGLITVTNVAAGVSSTATITATRTSYSTGSATVSASALASFTISYLGGTGGSGSAPTSPTSVRESATFTTPANTFVRAGYNFAGWSDGTNTLAAAATYPSTGSVSANVTLTATWTANSLTVSFDAQGGSSVTATSAAVGGSISSAPTAPIRSGYTFTGWAATNSGSVITFPYIHAQTADFTLYAIWSADALTVTYNAQGGSAVTSGSVNTGVSISTAPTSPTKSGYTFSGWSATSTGSVITFPYAHGQIAGFTLYAIWSADALTVTYNAQGGSAVTSGSVNTGANIAAAPTAPSRSGYTLSGWSATSAGSVITFPYTHGQTAGFTLYAIWSANALTVTYNSQSGSAVTSGSVNTGASISTAPIATTRDGYTLSGWSATSTGSVITFPYTHGQTANFSLYAIWSANALIVTYNSKGGSAVSNGSVNTGSNISASPTAPTKSGYTFSGWSATDGGSVITFPYTHGQTAGFTLYAIWSANALTVTYDAQGGSAVTSGSVNTGASISTAPTSPTRSGYTLSGWSTTSTGSVVVFPYAHGQTASFTLYAIWSANGLTVTYDSKGGSAVSNGSVNSGASISTGPITPTKAGYTFTGWSATDGGSVVTFPYAHGQTASFTLYAIWSANALTVTYNSQSGSAVASGTINTGASIATAPTAPTRAGYVLIGWSTTSTGLLVTFPYVHGQTANFTLYAIWSANANIVVFNANTGAGTMADQSIVTAVATALTSNTFTKTGYTFAGWNTNADGTTGTSYTNTQSVTLTAGMTVYAKWTINVYAITFDTNGGSGTMGTQSMTHGVATSLNASLYSRANYVFYRWATVPDGTGTTYNNLAQVTLTATTTLYAQWTPNTYVVTYNYDNATGGTSTTTSSFTTAGTAIVLPTPTRTGYTFAGWFSDAALTNSIGAAAANYSPSGNTLSLNTYAKWTAINYTFTYDTNSSDLGTVPTETSKQITQTVTVKANTGSLVRAGYTFSGWNTDSNGTGSNYLSGSLFTVGSANVILYAKWSPNTYTVTYNVNGASGNAQRSSSNVTSDSYTSGDSSVALPSVGTLERAGYTFGGWNTSAAGTGTNYLEAATYTTISNLTFFAKWNPVTYAITYNGNSSNGGTTPTTGDYTTGQASPYSIVANTFTKSSNVFGGWNTASDGSGTNYSPGATITTLADIVLYALWIPQFTLHYAINGGTVTSGSVPADQLYNINTSVGPVFSSLSRTGYTFDGWTNGASTIAVNGNFTILADSVLTAKWTPINYTISYNSDGGSEASGSFTKQIGQSFTVGSAVFKPGYNFTGWWNGTTLIGADAVIVVGSSSISYTAQWVAKVYRIAYDWNGGRGTAVSDVDYTFGTTAITLPVVGDRVRDGFTFAGWSESLNGSALTATYIPSQGRTLYARWNVGNFTITYNAGRGTVANASVPVANGGSTVLPLPTRANFVFNGWYTANAGGTSLGSSGTSFTPLASQTVYARWIQSSLFGITDSLTRIGSVITANNVSNTFLGANSNSSVAVSVPANALPAGTTINFDLVGNSSRAVGLLPGVSYVVSMAISWLTADETVPDTASGKPISVTITNLSIKAGAVAYAIVNNVSTLLGTATQDGSITVALTSDPEVVVAATKPGAPISVAATSNGAQQSVVSWSAPSSNGGSAITAYTVTASPGTGSCTTSSTTCTISSLTNGTAYTFTVIATNSVGSSPASSAASATTAGLHTVTFDAKGGSTVTAGSFLTTSTVSEPTAPTRAGYSFAGWSATDGGTVVTFPYAPGVATAITMFARWDALDNAVTFDSKGGSAVTDSVFSSGGTIAAPTAPTRTGFTFAGWSATDGGSAVTFPYAPGVVTDIALYAKWTAVTANVSGGGSSGGSNASTAPADPAPSTGGTPVRSNVTVVAPVTVVGNKDAKVLTVEVFTPAAGSNIKPPVIKIDAASEKFISEIKVVEGKLVLTPETGFSGKKTVTVTITENGADRIVQIPLTVLPEAVTKPVLTPTASNKSNIRWTASPNATAYTVLLNGKRVCATSATSCSVKQILGPDAVIEIVSNGGDHTVSEKIDADFRQNVPVPITRLVSATITKATLTKVDTKALDKIVALVRNQGFGTIVISEITTTKKTATLAAARIAAIKKYIDDKTGSRDITFEIVPATSRTYFNNISVKG